MTARRIGDDAWGNERYDAMALQLQKGKTMAEYTIGNYTVRDTSVVPGEHRYTCTCGWTNAHYISTTQVPDWVYAHLRNHVHQEGAQRMTLYRKPTKQERQDFINYGTPEIVLQAMIPVETNVQEQRHREIAKQFTDTECDIDYDADWPYECEAKDKYRDSHRVAVCRSHSAWWHATKEGTK